MKHPKGHKKNCGCPFCKLYRSKKRTSKCMHKKISKGSHHKDQKTQRSSKRRSSSRGWIFH